MCTICKKECKEECGCPRCPHRNGKLRGWPPRVQACTVCCIEDDRNCTNYECTITEHFIETPKKYCQLCCEKQYAIKFNYLQIGLYCTKHEADHKKRMKSFTFSS